MGMIYPLGGYTRRVGYLGTPKYTVRNLTKHNFEILVR